ncbi:peptidylprolyl isomerase [Acidaminobacter hydrogenoformans]|uniref:peptidylprolyl isomerase n=1 Tax=Acidaminobacter hydrogenoformans DSM 2784 TaxID=1120920 RepID=A0A1G5RPT3_9FIRM|nr:peptidylprolyl isomerase [Acidaminobacter hydrogenoformans]SCZ76135.1 foldase protein PrsA [Acidaminobacter hydrogenoformans DSM 2784]
MKTKKRSLSLILALILVLAFSLSGCQKKDSTGAVVPENAVAMVNGEVLDIETFNKAFAMVERSYNELYGEDIWTQEIQGQTVKEMIRERILEAMVIEKLITDHVAKTEFELSDEEVEEAYAAFVETAAEDADLTAFYEANGIDEAYIKDQIISKLYSEEFERIVYSEVESDTTNLESLYATFPIQVDASHILVAEAELAEELKGKIAAGEDFAELAKQYSIDTGSAGAGGALGLFGRGTMVEEFETAAFALKAGEVSEVIQSQFGYHIIKIHDVQTLDTMAANGASEQEIEIQKSALMSNVAQEAYTAKVEALRAEATVDTYPERVKQD